MGRIFAKLGYLVGVVAIAAGMGICASDPAAAYSQLVQRACKSDYMKFCPNYPLHSPALRQCMEAKAFELSQICVAALIDSGEVPKSRLKGK